MAVLLSPDRICVNPVASVHGRQELSSFRERSRPKATHTNYYWKNNNSIFLCLGSVAAQRCDRGSWVLLPNSSIPGPCRVCLSVGRNWNFFRCRIVEAFGAHNTRARACHLWHFSFVQKNDGWEAFSQIVCGGKLRAFSSSSEKTKFRGPIELPLDPKSRQNDQGPRIAAVLREVCEEARRDV